MGTDSVATPMSPRGRFGGLGTFVLTVAIAVGTALYLKCQVLTTDGETVQYLTIEGLDPVRLYTPDALSRHNSTHPTQIMLAIIGEVFDVTKKPQFYGGSGEYNFFTGCDASKAFVSGEFKGAGLTDEVGGLAGEDVLGLVEWKEFYHTEYTFMGRLAGGIFYDAQGQPTAALVQFKESVAIATKERDEQTAEEKRIPNCSSKWSQKEGGKIWCSIGYPRKTFVKQVGGETKFRCACHQDTSFDDTRRQLYKDCDASETSCQTSPPPLSS